MIHPNDISPETISARYDDTRQYLIAAAVHQMVQKVVLMQERDCLAKDNPIAIAADKALERLLENPPVGVENEATELLIHTWRSVWHDQFDARSLIGDATLVLRDALDPDWPAGGDWLPEPLATERADW